jgi:macrolide-specific efflux system membrane fusion protein
VTAVAYKEGELVTPQVSIVTVTNLNKLYLEVSLEQQSILRVKEGQLVYVSFESLRNEKSEGVVKSVYPRENQFIVRIELDAWPMGVLPGMTADVAILVGKNQCFDDPVAKSFRWASVPIARGKKEKISAKLGVLDGEWGEVISDNILETDELLIRK